MTTANILLVSNNASLCALVQGTLALLKPLKLFLIGDSLPDMSSIEPIQRIKTRQELEHIPIAAVHSCRGKRMPVQFVREYLTPSTSDVTAN